MSLDQDSLNRESRQRVRDSIKSSKREAIRAKYHARLAAAATKQVVEELRKADSISRNKRATFKAGAHLEKAQFALSRAQHEIQMSATHTSEATRISGIGTRILVDAISNLPQYITIGSKNFHRVGGMYDTEKKADSAAHKMRAPKGHRLIPIKTGEFKGQWLIYVLDE